jgi:hypothetical protein
MLSLDRNAKRIKFYSAEIISGELSNRNQVFNNVRNNKNVTKGERLRGGRNMSGADVLLGSAMLLIATMLLLVAMVDRARGQRGAW